LHGLEVTGFFSFAHDTDLLWTVCGVLFGLTTWCGRAVFRDRNCVLWPVENNWKVTTAGPSKIYCDLYRDGPGAESIGLSWFKVVHGDANREEEKKAGHPNLINAAISAVVVWKRKEWSLF
jgi:hypothetical protein